MKTSEWHINSEDDSSTWTERYENNKIYELKKGSNLICVQLLYLSCLFLISITITAIQCYMEKKMQEEISH